MRPQPHSATDRLQGTETKDAIGDSPWRDVPQTMRAALANSVRHDLAESAISALRAIIGDARDRADRSAFGPRSEASKE